MEPINGEPEAQQSDVVPPSASSYLDPNYWDKRFAREDYYEWFKDYSHFRHLVLAHIQPRSSVSLHFPSRFSFSCFPDILYFKDLIFSHLLNFHDQVLELGCGNSQMCEELYRDGVSKLTCIDLSPIAVEKMKTRLLSKGFKEIKVLEADMLDLPFEDQCFDVVVEKGTMDVLFVDSGDPWNPHPVTTERVIKMLKEVHRVLKHNGTFISIAFGQPHFRRRFFNDPEFTWSVEWNTFGETFHYFFYVLKKGNRTFESYEVLEPSANPSKSLFQEELDVDDYLFRINIDEM